MSRVSNMNSSVSSVTGGGGTGKRSMMRSYLTQETAGGKRDSSKGR
jgi:hypothetical protein